MQLVFFSASTSAAMEKWRSSICVGFQGIRVHETAGYDEFAQLIPKVKFRNPVLILFVAHEREIDRFRETSMLIEDLFLIVICGTSSKELYNNCWMLYPRLLLHHDDNTDLLAAVLNKLNQKLYIID